MTSGHRLGFNLNLVLGLVLGLGLAVLTGTVGANYNDYTNLTSSCLINTILIDYDCLVTFSNSTYNEECLHIYQDCMQIKSETLEYHTNDTNASFVTETCPGITDNETIALCSYLVEHYDITSNSTPSSLCYVCNSYFNHTEAHNNNGHAIHCPSFSQSCVNNITIWNTDHDGCLTYTCQAIPISSTSAPTGAPTNPLVISSTRLPYYTIMASGIAVVVTVTWCYANRSRSQSQSQSQIVASSGFDNPMYSIPNEEL
jgi:hypothetical protein